MLRIAAALSTKIPVLFAHGPRNLAPQQIARRLNQNKLSSFSQYGHISSNTISRQQRYVSRRSNVAWRPVRAVICQEQKIFSLSCTSHAISHTYLHGLLLLTQTLAGIRLTGRTKFESK